MRMGEQRSGKSLRHPSNCGASKPAWGLLTWRWTLPLTTTLRASILKAYMTMCLYSGHWSGSYEGILEILCMSDINSWRKSLVSPSFLPSVVCNKDVMGRAPAAILDHEKKRGGTWVHPWLCEPTYHYWDTSFGLILQEANLFLLGAVDSNPV